VEVGDVHERVDVLLHLDEEPEVRDALDLPFDPRAHGVVDADYLPRVRLGLLQTERDAPIDRFDVEDLDLDLLLRLEHLRGVGHAAPRHVGHVEQPVDAAEVDEGAVVGDVLDRPLEDDALLEHLEGLGLERRALALEHGAPGDDDVAARAVELEDGEAAALPEVAVEVARRADVGVRARQEGRYADVDPEPALHLADDGALDGAIALEGLLDLAPHLELLGLLPRQEDLARLG